MAGKRLGIGVIGAGRWAELGAPARLGQGPALPDSSAVCDSIRSGPRPRPDELRRGRGHRPTTATCSKRDDIDIIDVVTRDSEHFEINCAAIEAGKHVLSEKPVAHDHHDVARWRRWPRRTRPEDQGGLHVQVQPGGPLPEGHDRPGRPGHAVHLQRLRAELAVADARRRRCAAASGGRPAASRWPRWRGTARRSSTSATGSWNPTSPRSSACCGTSSRSGWSPSTGTMARFNIDDGDIFIGEFASGAICSVQSSFVTVGNYPGIEVRVYGSRGRRHRPAGRGIRHLRDAAGRLARRRRVPGGRGAGGATTRRAAARGSRGGPCTTRTSPRTSPARCSARSPATRATSTTGCGCSRSINAVETLPPRAALGEPAARRRRSARMRTPDAASVAVGHPGHGQHRQGPVPARAPRSRRDRRGRGRPGPGQGRAVRQATRHRARRPADTRA